MLHKCNVYVVSYAVFIQVCVCQKFALCIEIELMPLCAVKRDEMKGSIVAIGVSPNPLKSVTHHATILQCVLSLFHRVFAMATL